MCGILGVAGADVTREALAAVAALMAHRGPDDAGVYVGESVGLAARRLSIIDLAGGHQPLSNEDKSIWTVFNGEIVNAPTLRGLLEARGHVFRTASDTEVLTHGYETWGDDVVTHLRGMFALAIWDGRRRRLLLARDRLGIKPLYYAAGGGRLTFASEIAPLLAAWPAFPRRADPRALAALLQVGFVPGPRTAVAGVWQLPAGHRLTWHEGAVSFAPYWSLASLLVSDYANKGWEEAVAVFRTALRDAVDAWRLSDVPVGSLLSGGVDSGALAALLTDIGGAPIDTFHIAFAAASHDESPRARETARAIGSRHHELYFDEKAFDRLPAIVARLATPLASLTAVPLYLLYEACRAAGFKVILTGEGADELLGGYHWFDGDRRLRCLLRLPRRLRATLARAPLPVSLDGRRVLARGNRDPLARYLLWHEATHPATRGRLWARPMPAADIAADWRAAVTTDLDRRHPLEQFLLLDAHARLPDFINLEVDRMSMAHSVEARPPFLDHELWALAAQMPPHFKLSAAGDKRLLRAAMAPYLPERVRRRVKQGLAAPHAAWWRRERLPAWAEESLDATALAESGYFNAAAVAGLRAAHRAGRADHSRALSAVLTTQLWHQALNINGPAA